MSKLAISPDAILKEAVKRKDGDQLFKPDEGFKALMGDDEDTVAFVFQHVSPDYDGTLTSVAKTTRGILSFGAVVQGEVERGHRKGEEEKSYMSTRKPFRHWKPSLIVERTEVICNEGDQAMLQVQIKGYPKPDMRCTFHDIPIKPSAKYKIYHENEEHFLLIVINDVHFEDAGVYAIMAENEIGFASVDINLTVIRHKYPEIKTTIEDVSLAVDQVLIIPTEVDGIPKPDMRFLKDGRDIVQNEHIKIIENYPQYTLVINNTTLKDTGIYKFMAENVHGLVEDSVKIDVKKAPTILEAFEDAEVLEQDVFHNIHTVEFGVKLEAFPRPLVKWYLDGDELLDTIPEITRIQTRDIVNVVVNEPTTDLSGEYTCKISNECGEAQANARLTVNCSPRIIVTLNDQTIDEGLTLTLEIVVRGYPSPTFKWFRNNQEIDADERIQIGLETYGKKKYKIICIISEISYAERGDYEIEVTKGFGTTKSRCIINVLILLEVDMPDMVIKEGSDITYTVRSFANPLPEATWASEGTVIDPEEKKDRNKLITSHNGTEFRMGIRKAKILDAGVHQCILGNSVGMTRYRAALAVLRRKRDDSDD